LIEQQAILLTGTQATGQILQADETSTEIFEETIYELQIRVYLSEEETYETRIRQPLSDSEAQKLRPGVWATLRYKAEAPEKVALVQIDVPPPELKEIPGDTVIEWPPSHDASPTPSEDEPETPPKQQEPQVAPAAPSQNDAPGASLTCRQARACCEIAGGTTCAPFTQSGLTDEICTQALRGFDRLARATGKSCSGLNRP
jgi:hypothetical protein